MGLKKAEKKTKLSGKPYLPFKQDGVTYNLYEMPKGFVIKGDLNLSGKGLTELPDLSEVVVEGSFYCSHNQLTTLKGAPRKVSGHFSCYGNQLTSLKGAPQKVGGDFYCNTNKLTTLEGAPQIVGGNFYCSHNELTSLLGISVLDGGNKIACDYDLAKKYGVYDDSQSFWAQVLYKDLIESPLYKSEVGAANIRRKLSQEPEEMSEAQMQHQEKMRQNEQKVKAAYEAWCKEHGIEPKAR